MIDTCGMTPIVCETRATFGGPDLSIRRLPECLNVYPQRIPAVNGTPGELDDSGVKLRPLVVPSSIRKDWSLPVAIWLGRLQLPERVGELKCANDLHLAVRGVHGVHK